MKLCYQLWISHLASTYIESVSDARPDTEDIYTYVNFTTLVSSLNIVVETKAEISY